MPWPGRNNLTCRADLNGRSSLAQGSLVLSSPQKNTQAWWFAGDVRHTLYPDRSRRAADSWILFAHGRRTAADPCDSAFGCRVPALAEWELQGCRWPWVQYAVSCRYRWGYRPLLHPGMDCRACPCQNTDSLLQKRSPWLSAQIEESSEGQHAWLDRDKSDSSENTYLELSTQARRWCTVRLLQLLRMQMSMHMYSSNKGILHENNQDKHIYQIWPSKLAFIHISAWKPWHIMTFSDFLIRDHVCSNSVFHFNTHRRLHVSQAFVLWSMFN